MGADVKIIESNSLQVLPDGYQFNVRLNWYRTLPVSCVEKLNVTLDGVPVPADQIRFEINDHQFQLAELEDQIEEFWFVQDSARIHILHPGRIAAGETHVVEAEMALRFPYIGIGPGRFLTNTSRCKATEVARA